MRREACKNWFGVNVRGSCKVQKGPFPSFFFVWTTVSCLSKFGAAHGFGTLAGPLNARRKDATPRTIQIPNLEPKAGPMDAKASSSLSSKVSYSLNS